MDRSKAEKTEPGTGRPLPQSAPWNTLRYARHLVLPDIGESGQRKLLASKVLLVGAGGLGAPVGLYLAAAGVGRLGVLDDDTVELTNLQRQVIYGTTDIGVAKAGAASARLRDLNPEIDVVAHDLKLSSENALEILADYDVIIDGTDNFATRYLINDACVLLGKPDVYGSVFRFEGQVSVFSHGGGPCYRCLYPEPPPAGLVPGCADGGVVGVLPGIIGSLQANEAIKLILGVGEPLRGRLLLFDALAVTFHELALKRNPDCPVCGDRPTIDALIDYDSFCGTSAPPATPEISARDLSERLRSGDAPTLIDVRETSEHTFCNIGGDVIPVRELPTRIAELDPSRDIVVYCRSGIRSATAVAYLRDHGFARVRHLRGGILAWADEIDPSIPKY